MARQPKELNCVNATGSCDSSVCSNRQECPLLMVSARRSLTQRKFVPRLTAGVSPYGYVKLRCASYMPAGIEPKLQREKKKAKTA